MPRNQQSAMTTTKGQLTVYNWKVAKFGSQEAFLRHWDSLSETEEGQLEQVRLNLEWMQAICEDAGIPYHGWIGNVLGCARARLVDNEGERETVHVLNKKPGRVFSAYEYWTMRDYCSTGNPYCA
jgi:hypothetical protein